MSIGNALKRRPLPIIWRTIERINQGDLTDGRHLQRLVLPNRSLERTQDAHAIMAEVAILHCSARNRYRSAK